MNFSHRIFAAALLALAALAACNKDSSSKPKASMTCKIDGVDWEARADFAGITVQPGVTNLIGKAVDGTVVTITLQATAAGTYPLLEGGDHAGVYLKPDGSGAFASNQGNDPTAQCKISSINTADSTMSGTFQFTAFRLIDGKKVVVTEGVFTDVPFVSEVSSSAAGTFSCKVNGTQFTPSLTFGTLNLGILQIGGSSSAGTPSVSLALDENIAVGTTDLDGFTNFGQYNPNSSTFLQSTSGNVTVSKHDKAARKIVGTFDFEAAEFGGGPTTASITSGSFNISY